MEFNQLESFLSVVKHKSFSKAAKDLYLSQPTISNNIQRLEQEVGATLLDRKSKKISLTEAGKTFYSYALELVNLREQAKHSLDFHLKNIEGSLEISSSSIPGHYLLPDIIRNFLEKYPKVSFSVTTETSADIIDEILEARENMGIVGKKFPSNSLEYIAFHQDQLLLVTPNIEPYSSMADEDWDLSRLSKEYFIFRQEGSGTRAFVAEALAKKNISKDNLNIIAYIDSNAAIKKMIEKGLGLSFLSKLAIEKELELGLVKAFNLKDVDLKRNFYLVLSKDRTLSPLMEAFKNFIEERKLQE